MSEFEGLCALTLLSYLIFNHAYGMTLLTLYRTNGKTIQIQNRAPIVGMIAFAFAADCGLLTLSDAFFLTLLLTAANIYIYRSLFDLRSVRIKRKEMCAICQVYRRRGSRLQQTPCGHHFDEACLRTWFEDNTTCPLCRSSCLGHATGIKGLLIQQVYK